MCRGSVQWFCEAVVLFYELRLSKRHYGISKLGKMIIFRIPQDGLISIGVSHRQGLWCWMSYECLPSCNVSSHILKLEIFSSTIFPERLLEFHFSFSTFDVSRCRPEKGENVSRCRSILTLKQRISSVSQKREISSVACGQRA